MTLLIGKQCTDGVLFLADSIRITENSGPPVTKLITTGAIKALCGKRGDDHYCMVFGGHAGLDTTKSTLEWLKEAATNPVGSLQDNVEKAAQETLRDAVAHGFKPDEEEQRIRLRYEGRIFVLVSIRPNEWWFVNADHDNVAKNHQAAGFVVVSLLAGNPDGMKELLSLRDPAEMPLKDAAASCGRIFDRASELFQEGCRYPGTVCIHRTDGFVMETFNTFNELKKIAERWP